MSLHASILALYIARTISIQASKVISSANYSFLLYRFFDVFVSLFTDRGLISTKLNVNFIEFSAVKLMKMKPIAHQTSTPEGTHLLTV